MIDSHVDAYEANAPKRPWHTVPNWPDHLTGAELVVAMDKLGVEGAIFISALFTLNLKQYSQIVTEGRHARPRHGLADLNRDRMGPGSPQASGEKWEVLTWLT